LKFQAKLKKAFLVIATVATLAFVFGVLAPQVSFAQTSDSSSDRKVKQRVNPSYPELARHTNISGVVKLEATISASGQVRTVKVLGGHPLLAGAAEDALRKWKYEPGSGETTTVVEFHFNPGM
jgi:TonB family protein